MPVLIGRAFAFGPYAYGRAGNLPEYSFYGTRVPFSYKAYSLSLKIVFKHRREVPGRSIETKTHLWVQGLW